MRRIAILPLILILASAIETRSSAAPQARGAAAGDQTGLVAHGEYLATSVAMCVQCHSPRDERGNIIEAQQFRGGAIPVGAPYWKPDWAFRAPAIAGLPGFTDEQVIDILTEGQTAGRRPPTRPMPPFRMSRADAEAIVAFLRTR